MDEFIYNQRRIPKDKWRYGLRTSAATGCGWIASHNVLRLFGLPSEPEALIREYALQIPLLHGLAGTSLFGVYRFFQKRGFPLQLVFRRKNFDAAVKDADAAILFYRWRKKWKLGAHFVALHHTRKGFIGYNTYSNSVGPDMYGPSLQGFLKKRKYFGPVLMTIQNPYKINTEGEKPMVLVVGSINMDVNILLDHILRPGETLLCRESVFKSPGGKGSNQAVAAAKLGAEVVMLGCVGKDENGQQMLASLQSAGVNTDYVMVKEECPTSTAYINVAASGENAIAVDSSANMHVSAEYVSSYPELFAKADYCVFQLEIPIETVKAAKALCKKYNVKTVLNPSPMHERAPELLEGIDYLIPNETEAEGLLGKPFEETCDEDWQSFMETHKIGHMIITLGSAGCKYFETGKTPVLCPTKPRKAVDTCGAGDTFLGGFVTALSEGKNEPDAIAFAASAAGIQITRSGAQAAMPTRAEVDEDMQ